MIKMNGAYGEGGSQILRTSLTLSALTHQPVLIENIRTNRSKAGLCPQHLSAFKAMAILSNAEIKWDVLGSQRLLFSPSNVSSGKYTFEIRTAGALSLVFQTIFEPLSFANSPSHITLTGGTHVNWSPSYHYLRSFGCQSCCSSGFVWIFLWSMPALSQMEEERWRQQSALPKRFAPSFVRRGAS